MRKKGRATDIAWTASLRTTAGRNRWSGCCRSVVESNPAIANVPTAATSAKHRNIFHMHKIKHEFVTGLHAAVVQFVEGGNKNEKSDRYLGLHVLVGHGIRRCPDAV
jgi:hypothetical protein